MQPATYTNVSQQKGKGLSVYVQYNVETKENCWSSNQRFYKLSVSSNFTLYCL